jgi:DNA-directed RNA polymerase specialized sigma24 family protein
MLRRLILSRIAAAEKDLGVPLDYCRFIIRVSIRSFFKFAKFLAVDEYRRVLPPGPFYVARTVATRHEDCGTCVQIAVNQARKAGVSAELLRTVLDGKLDALPEEYRLLLLLRADDRLSYEDVAALTEQSPDAVRGKLHRARKAFVAHFEKTA